MCFFRNIVLLCDVNYLFIIIQSLNNESKYKKEADWTFSPKKLLPISSNSLFILNLMIKYFNLFVARLMQFSLMKNSEVTNVTV